MNRILILIAFSVLLISGCKSSQSTTSTPKVSKSSLSDSQRAEVTFLFFNANKEKLLGNLNNAADLFAEVIRKDGNNAAAMYELSNIYAEQKKYTDALFFSKSAYLIDPSNPWYTLSYVDVLQKNKKYDEAAEVVGKLVNAYPDRVDYYYEWASALLYSDKTAEAIKVYDKLETKTGINKEVSMQKARLYQRMNKNDKAVLELQRLIDNNPADAQSYGMLAELYQSMGDKEKALETYNKILKVDPENPYIHLSLADYYRNNGEKEKSVEELKKAFLNKDLDIDTKMSILSSYYALVELHPELKEQALEMCRLLIQAHPNESRAHAVYGDFLNQDEKPNEALVEFKIARDLGAKEFVVYRSILYLYAQVQAWDSLIVESEEALTLFPDQPEVYLLNGIANSQKKKYAEAATAYQSGVKMVVDNKKLEVQFYASLGDTYQELKDFQKSEENYDKALEMEPKNATVLNNYAYYLSVRGEKLTKAEEMSRLSNEIEPSQASYQDTYGWIMYKQGNYKDAKVWIEKALANTPGKSGTLLEHYGDVLFKLGENIKALEYWQQAKDAGDASELLDRKLQEKKLFD
ncbi:MAG: tetratricopeptide repeat protein [Bacteroidetes bacterium]|nr:tetratricopeptide repeat protein [Bacteroidota bacterium]